MLRRTGFKKPQLERKPIVYTPVPENLRRRVSMGKVELQAAPKQVTPQNKTAEDRRHMDAVAQLGCIVCWRVHGLFQPLVELHHPRKGTGMGQRSAHKDVLPLCYEHHRGNSGVHGLGTKGFAKHYGFDEADLLVEVTERLRKAA